MKNQSFFDAKRRGAFIPRKAKILYTAIRSFFAEDHLLQATALTYYTLFAIVPILALLFGISKGFNLEGRLKHLIAERFAEQEDIIVWMYRFADTTLRNADGGVVAGIGVVVLFWTVIRLAGYIEKSFNQIWHIRQGRNIFRKVSDYLSVLVIAPILLIVTSSSTIFAQKLMMELPEKWNLGHIGLPLMTLGFELLPVVMAWVLFAFIYFFIPNTKVKWGSALLAGFVAALLYQAAQMAYIEIQLKVSSYNSIYGSFSAIPLFLIWMQWSWMITLLGAEIAFVDQHFNTGQFEKRNELISRELSLKYMLTITSLIVHGFERNEKLYTENDIAERTLLPLFRVREALAELLDSGVLQRVDIESERDFAFIPGIPPEQMTVCRVLKMINRSGVNTPDVPELSDFVQMSGALDKINEVACASAANRLLKDA